jgi:mRNA interferase RelE/StbE
MNLSKRKLLEIKISDSAKKFIDKAENVLCSRIVQKIEKLSAEPFPHDCIRLAGFKGIFRVRVGNYRILYEVKCSELIIIKIDKRGRAYKD